MRIWQGGIAPGSLASFALSNPQAVSAELRDKLNAWAEYVTGPAAGLQSNPFGIYKWDTENFFNPNQNNRSWQSHVGLHDWWQGEDGRCIVTAWAAFTASTALDNPQLRILAYNQLNWICGVNPMGFCMIKDTGDRSCPRVYGAIGADTGTIINGLVATSDTDNSPAYDLGWRTNEVWSPYNAWMLMALSSMVYTDDCQYAKNQPGYGNSSGDFNGDCFVNLKDLAVFSADWLTCYSSDCP